MYKKRTQFLLFGRMICIDMSLERPACVEHAVAELAGEGVGEDVQGLYVAAHVPLGEHELVTDQTFPHPAFFIPALYHVGLQKLGDFTLFNSN